MPSPTPPTPASHFQPEPTNLSPQVSAQLERREERAEAKRQKAAPGATSRSRPRRGEDVLQPAERRRMPTTQHADHGLEDDDEDEIVLEDDDDEEVARTMELRPASHHLHGGDGLLLRI